MTSIAQRFNAACLNIAKKTTTLCFQVQPPELGSEEQRISPSWLALLTYVWTMIDYLWLHSGPYVCALGTCRSLPILRSTLPVELLRCSRTCAALDRSTSWKGNTASKSTCIWSFAMMNTLLSCAAPLDFWIFFNACRSFAAFLKPKGTLSRLVRFGRSFWFQTWQRIPNSKGSQRQASATCLAVGQRYARCLGPARSRRSLGNIWDMPVQVQNPICWWMTRRCWTPRDKAARPSRSRKKSHRDLACPFQPWTFFWLVPEIAPQPVLGRATSRSSLSAAALRPSWRHCRHGFSRNASSGPLQTCQ